MTARQTKTLELTTTRLARARRGFSYIEVCLAMIVIGICLIPAARALPSLLTWQRKVQTKYELTLIAQAKLENALIDLAQDFSARDEEGDLNDYGHADWRYHLVATIYGGGVGRYAVIRSDAWYDEDGDIALGQDEAQVRVDTMLSNCEWRE